jgi:heme-degrading monooxygenase HmoA
MSVVKINALQVPEDGGQELERRFSGRAHAVDAFPGFEGFQLLRPVRGEDRYFVVTTWDSEASYQSWANGQARENHGGGGRPVATGANLLEFEVVDLDGDAV